MDCEDCEIVQHGAVCCEWWGMVCDWCDVVRNSTEICGIVLDCAGTGAGLGMTLLKDDG